MYVLQAGKCTTLYLKRLTWYFLEKIVYCFVARSLMLIEGTRLSIKIEALVDLLPLRAPSFGCFGACGDDTGLSQAAVDVAEK